MLIIMEITPILIVLTFIVFVSEAYKSPTWATSTSRTPCALFGAKLLPNPQPNSIGNFFEKDESMSFIQCYMLSVADIEGVQYGVGFPVDMPVMLCYFDGNELLPVRPEYPDYDHLVNHVSMQMDDNDFQLYKTPVALTLQGEFEDEELNQVVHGIDDLWGDEGGSYQYDEEEDDDDDDDDDDEEELTLEEVMKIENIDEDFDDDDEWVDGDDDDVEDDEDYSDTIDGENGENVSSFWNSAPTGRLSEELRSLDDVTIMGKAKGDLSSIPEDSIVSAEDTKGLKKAHRKADRIMEYADDLKLIASFHYRKRNFHLVKLLEPIFIVGKRIMDIKGYYFTLLPDDEAALISPQIESLIMSQGNDPKRFKEATGGLEGSNTGSIQATKESVVTPARNTARTSRRKWTERARERRERKSQ